jgi:hypothetical protein
MDTTNTTDQDQQDQESSSTGPSTEESGDNQIEEDESLKEEWTDEDLLAWAKIEMGKDI